MYDNGDGVAEDDAEAVKWFRLAAEQGLANAQHNLGVMYDNGEGVPQDVAAFRLAADQGFAEAQVSLSFIYANGIGVPQDLVLAHLWSNLAATHGQAGGAENRDLFATLMTPDQIAEAQRLAREWTAAHQ